MLVLILLKPNIPTLFFPVFNLESPKLSAKTFNLFTDFENFTSK